jgi:hypothetical protein
LVQVREAHERAVREGFAGVELPYALAGAAAVEPRVISADATRAAGFRSERRARAPRSAQQRLKTAELVGGPRCCRA